MKKFFISILFLGLNILAVSFTSAVEISLVDYFKEQRGEKVVLYVDTGNDKVNAISGRLFFDQNKVEVKSLTEGNSSFVLSLEKMTDNKEGVIDFAVVAPGGFAGRGELITINFVTRQNGLDEATFKIAKIEALSNDGLGTSLPVSWSSSPLANFADLEKIAKREDTTPPELFTPIIARGGPDLSKGKYLFFSTVDKGSGVEGYYFAKSWRYFNLKRRADDVANNLNWQRIEPPSLLLGWSPLSFHYLKVSDYAGNFILVELKDLRPIYVSWLFWFIIIFSAIGVWIWRKKLKK